MSSSNVSSVSNHFSTASEGFSTTTSGSISPGGTSVGLNSVVGLTNGNIFVGIIEPGVTGSEQVFTGTVDVSGSQITGVVWTRNTNVSHAAGVSVVDYVTGTQHNMMTKGLLVAHNQDGTHKSGATYPNANLSVQPTITDFTNAGHTHASAAQGGQLTGSNAIVAATLKAAQMFKGMVYRRQGGTTGDATYVTKGTSNTDTSAKDIFLQIGAVGLSTVGTDVAVTFPVAYNFAPNVIAGVASATSANVACAVKDVTTTGFNIRSTSGDGSSETANWQAYGQ